MSHRRTGVFVVAFTFAASFAVWAVAAPPTGTVKLGPLEAPPQRAQKFDPVPPPPPADPPPTPPLPGPAFTYSTYSAQSNPNAQLPSDLGSVITPTAKRFCALTGVNHSPNANGATPAQAGTHRCNVDRIYDGRWKVEALMPHISGVLVCTMTCFE